VIGISAARPLVLCEGLDKMGRPPRWLLGVLRDNWVVVLGLLAVAALVIAVDPAKLGRALADADPRFLLLMLPTVFLLYLFHGVAWWIALRGVGAPVGIRQAIMVSFISQVFDFLPGGDLWRVAIVKSDNGEHLDAGPIVATVVFDNLVFFFVLTFAMVPAVLRLPLLGVPLAVALLPQLTIFLILLWRPLYDFLVGVVGKMRLFKRFQPQLLLLGPAFRQLTTPRTVAPIVAVDAVCAVLAIGLFDLAVTAVHASGFGLKQVAFTYASGQVLAGLTSLPAALGIYEGMMTGMMAVQGVAPAAAAAAAFIYRAINDILMAIVGLGVALVVEREYLMKLVHPAEPVTR
jgi:uncharacterized membrane protein YbhN (UPF0104 family)